MSFHQKKCERQSKLLKFYAMEHLRLRQQNLLLSEQKWEKAMSAMAYRNGLEKLWHCVEHLLSCMPQEERHKVIDKYSLYGDRMRNWKKGKYCE